MMAKGKRCPACGNQTMFNFVNDQEICSECGCPFLDFESMAEKLQNWIGISKRGLWKGFCPNHRRELFHGMTTVCEVIQHCMKEGYTPRDFKADLPEDLVKLCLSKMKHSRVKK